MNILLSVRVEKAALGVNRVQSDTGAEYPQDKCLHEVGLPESRRRFIQTTRQVVWGEEQLTYMGS